jgi:hypothetical protein
MSAKALARPAIRVLLATAVLASMAASVVPARAATDIFAAEADAYVEASNPTTNFGGRTTLETDNSPVVESYLRFTVSGVEGTVTGARLRLFVTNPSSNGPAVYRTDPNQTWTEGGITWNNRVVRTGAALADVGAVSSGTWVEYDVTAAVPGNGAYTFNLVTSSGDGTDFNSRQASANRPELVVDSAPSGPDITPPETTIISGPPATTSSTSASFDFASSEPGSTFDCRLDGAAYAGCSAPEGYSELAPGTHAFEVYATDAAGNPDATPATWEWTVTEGSGTPATTTFGSEADARVVQGSPNSNYGTQSYLEADTSPVVESYVRFDVSGLDGTVTRARLRLYVTNASGDGPAVYRAGSTWSETGITWNTKPARTGAALANAARVASGAYFTYDVTGAVSGDGSYTFALVAESVDGVDYRSRQASSNRPELVVETNGGAPPPPSGEGFDFGLIGDTGYTSSQLEQFSGLRERMNDAGLAFTVHDGDIKAGSTSCSDSIYTANRDRFDAFEHPFIYTPGDNEWSDCSNSDERLDYLREVFFPTDQSLGHPSMTLQRQPGYPENARWHHGGVTFVTLNQPGSDNNVGDSSEYRARNGANLDWLDGAFDAAAARDSLGVVVVTHANPGLPPDHEGRDGFDDFRAALVDEVQAWGKPVILVHGDTHEFRIDHPRVDGVTLPNFTRIETYATSDVHWVRVRVVPDDPDMFQISGQD